MTFLFLSFAQTVMTALLTYDPAVYGTHTHYSCAIVPVGGNICTVSWFANRHETLKKVMRKCCPVINNSEQHYKLYYIYKYGCKCGTFRVRRVSCLYESCSQHGERGSHGIVHWRGEYLDFTLCFGLRHQMCLNSLHFQVDTNRIVHIHSVIILRRSDKRKDRVEISPEQLSAASTEAEISFHLIDNVSVCARRLSVIYIYIYIVLI